MAIIASATLSGWVFTLALLALIFAGFLWATVISLAATDRYLRVRGVGVPGRTCALALLGLACFVGLWLPIALVLIVGRGVGLTRRLSRSV